jgi:hypothetical protein
MIPIKLIELITVDGETFVPTEVPHIFVVNSRANERRENIGYSFVVVALNPNYFAMIFRF